MELPEKQGLYDPRNEHDSCGVGFVANIKGQKSHDIVRQGLQILVNLDHRGAVGADHAAAQEFPSKLIRIVAPSPGGGGDFVARLIAQGLTSAFGQQVIVDNRSGGVIQGELVAKAAPDGHTLLLSGSGLWLMPFMRSNVPFDPLLDFAPVTLFADQPMTLSARKDFPASTMPEFAAYLKANDLNG